MYRTGMEALHAEDACCVEKLSSLLGKTSQKKKGKTPGKLNTEPEWCPGWPRMYVATNREHHFGVNSLLNIPSCQELADREMPAWLSIPSSIHEIIIQLQEYG